MLPHEENTEKRPDPYVGKVFDKYRLIEKLGAGGMGWVYRAEQARMKRHVAVKILPFTMGNDEVNVKRIEREAAAMGNLRHPSIATIFDFGFSEEGQPYLVMELISGRSLGDLLHEEKVLDPIRAINIISQVADAMDYAHKYSIIHRDLKPDNIMLTSEHKDDFVKILDFGIAKSVDTVVNVSQSLTRPGTVVGSPFYMSPEQCLGQKLDGGSDIYSLGVMLYEMVTGTVPCKGATIYETICRKTTEQPPSFPPGCAEWTELERLTRMCLAPMRADRPESMQVVCEMLDALKPSTVNLTPSSVQNSLTADSVSSQVSAVSSIPQVTPNPGTDSPVQNVSAPLATTIKEVPAPVAATIQEVPTPVAATLNGGVSSATSPGLIGESNSGTQLPPPSQIISTLPEITDEQNTVVTSKVHDTANELETITSGIETDAPCATVSAGATVPEKEQFSFSNKAIAIAVGAIVVLGGLTFKLATDSRNATAGSARDMSSAVSTGKAKPSVSNLPAVKPESLAKPDSLLLEPGGKSNRTSSLEEESTLIRPDTVSPTPKKFESVRPAKKSKPHPKPKPNGRQARSQHSAGQSQPKPRFEKVPAPVKRFLRHLINGSF